MLLEAHKMMQITSEGSILYGLGNDWSREVPLAIGPGHLPNQRPPVWFQPCVWDCVMLSTRMVSSQSSLLHPHRVMHEKTIIKIGAATSARRPPSLEYHPETGHTGRHDQICPVFLEFRYDAFTSSLCSQPDILSH